jgi:hypothetical protein
MKYTVQPVVPALVGHTSCMQINIINLAPCEFSFFEIINPWSIRGLMSLLSVVNSYIYNMYYTYRTLTGGVVNHHSLSS